MANPYWVERKGAPSISIYLINDDTPEVFAIYKLSCLFCKRTIADGIKGRVDAVVDAPLPADEFDLAINIQCKMCGQKYRILGMAMAN